MPSPEAMSEAEAAASLRIHPKTLARWRKAGKVSYDRTPGGRVRYQFEYLLALRIGMKVSAHAPLCSHKSGEN